MISATLAVLLVGFSVSLALTPLVANLALRQGWLDRPDGGRKAHPLPIPRLGGISVYAAFLVAFGVLVTVVPELTTAGPGALSAYVALAVACGAVVLVGLADDLSGVSPATKIIVQAGAGLFLYLRGYQISAVTNPFGDPIALGAFSLPLTILWFVGMSNAFNLIDGLDGLAAGVALFATASLFAAAALNGQWETALLAAGLAGGILGFLPYNFSPASVFLGDCGSLFVGFALAAFAIQSSMKASAAIAVMAPVLALALPILDACLSVLRRFIAGRNIFEADRDHIHHRLLRLGLSPRRAVISLYGAAALFTSLSLVVMTGRVQAAAAAAIAVLLIVWAGVRYLGYAELSALQLRFDRSLVGERRKLANSVHLVRMREGFARPEGLEALWRNLTDTGSRLGFDQVELRLDGAGSPGPFTWPPAAAPGETQGWALTVTLEAEGQRLGEVRLAKRVPETQASFDLNYFIKLLSAEFPVALARALAPAPPAPTGEHVIAVEMKRPSGALAGQREAPVGAALPAPAGRPNPS